MSEYRLTQGIIALSVTNNWGTAKNEWALAEVYYQEEPEVCLCGHFPINEICVLTNAHNGNEAVVGNVCVKKFLGLPSGLIFQGLHRIAEDETKALNEAATRHAHGRGWITDKEAQFSMDTKRAKRFSPRQMTWRVKINRKVLRAVQHVAKTRSPNAPTVLSESPSTPL